jgi:hypothetical protein
VKPKLLVPILLGALASLAIAAPLAYGKDFSAEAYPASINATAEGHTMTFEAGKLKCKKATFTGELTAAKEELELTPAYSECTAFGIASTVKPEGCKYRFNANNSNMDLVCPAGKSMIISVSTFCEIKVESQSGLKSVEYENVAGPPNSMTVKMNLEGIKYTVVKESVCGKPGTKTNGLYSGTISLASLQKDNPVWVVSVGDSYISGEGGRWAGNTAVVPPTGIDALGAAGYEDAGAGKGEKIALCHRSSSAEIHIGGGIRSENFACSGAKAATTGTGAGETFKPGLDFYNGAKGEGQALMLEKFAKANTVKMVAVSIGGNDFNFGSIVETCVQRWLLWLSLCSELPAVTANFTGAPLAANRAAIKGAIENVATAMKNANYKETDYTILLQNYPTPVPLGNQFRYGETYAEKLELGGCPLYNEDATWADAGAVATIGATVFAAAGEAKLGGVALKNIKQLELYSTFSGRRLCENGVNLLESTTGGAGGVALKAWNEVVGGVMPAVDETEWVNQIRIAEENGYMRQESVHPNYWGQLALRNCARLAYNNGAPKGGKCVQNGNGLNAKAPPEPNMKLE